MKLSESEQVKNRQRGEKSNGDASYSTKLSHSSHQLNGHASVKAMDNGNTVMRVTKAEANGMSDEPAVSILQNGTIVYRKVPQ